MLRYVVRGGDVWVRLVILSGRGVILWGEWGRRVKLGEMVLIRREKRSKQYKATNSKFEEFHDESISIYQGCM